MPTTFAVSQSAFTLPAAADPPTVEMLRAYVLFEDAFRRSELTTTLDPAVRTYATGNGLTTVVNSLAYLKDHGQTQQGPWRFHVTVARTSGPIGVADVCVGGGFYTVKGTTQPYTNSGVVRVDLSSSSGQWLVTNYTDRQEGCS